jgi:(1->4)-alpha-D-glucan 1-alpha-D-glucosylmutase
MVLERGELQLALEDGALVLTYFDRTLPINPRRQPLVLERALAPAEAELGADHPDVVELRETLESLRAMPAITDTADAAGRARHEAAQQGRERLSGVMARSAAVRRALERAIQTANGMPGVPDSYDLLHELLEVQAYRLAYWRTAFDEINYRRFFDINELAGLRMEDPRVFAATHALLFELVEGGHITGIRLDHPDGLYDPAAYMQSLAAAVAARRPAAAGDVYLVVEKILGRGERLREDWPVHGTTGYNALNTINGLFVHRGRLGMLRRFYRRFTGYRMSPADAEYAAKRVMMRTAMASELNVLARTLNRISEADRRARDFTLNGLRRALMEVVACFPVYRTYVTAQGASEEDVDVVDAAIAEALRRNPVQEPSIFAFIRRVLLSAPPGAETEGAAARGRDRHVAFAHKFQQYTAPVVAKGLEDTAFYNDVLLISANEVGGSLRHRARSVDEFHRENLHRLARWPLEMTAGSTHDTKRGEDARARINVISELPEEWRALVLRWAALNEGARSGTGASAAPDRNDEWLYYQALVGAWPAERPEEPVPPTAPEDFVERMQVYMRKAIKEAKRHTSWLTENAHYENAVRAFVDATLRGASASGFLASFVPFQRRLAWFGMLNSLAQLVLRVGAPGVPDIYQGSELWNFSLVDPDNRRPVDFDARRRLLASVERATPRELLDAWPDGRVKLFTLTRALRFRRDHPELLLYGDYEPLTSESDDPHVIAFGRRRDGEELIVAAPRFVATMLGGVIGMPLGMSRWRLTSIRLPARLASARFSNVFTGELIEPLTHRGVPWLPAGSVFQSFPVAMLHAR